MSDDPWADFRVQGASSDAWADFRVKPAQSQQQSPEPSDVPALNEKTGLYDYRGKSYTQEALGKQMNAELTAEQLYKKEGRFMHDVRSFSREATGGWAPNIVGNLVSAATGTDAERNTAIEREMSNINARERPVEDAASRIAGGVTGVMGAGGLIRAAPGGAAALDAIGNTISRIPAITSAGRQAAAEALAAGQAAPVSLGTGAVASGLTYAPFKASESMAENGASIGNAVHGAAEGFGEGALAGGAFHTAAGAVGPWATRQAQALIDAGVPLSIGQTTGGIPQRLENIAASAPLVGSFTRGTLRNAQEGLNEVGANRALAHIGEQVPGEVRAGHEMVDHVFDRLGAAYDNVLGRLSAPLSEFAPNTRWGTDMGQIRHDAVRSGIRGEGLAYLDDLINNVQERMQLASVSPARGQAAAINGQALKNVESSLSGEGRAVRASNNPSVNQTSPFVDRIRDALRNVLAHTNPQDAAELQRINNGYAIASILRRAANSAGTNEGVYTAAQLSRAVRAQDPSISGGQFARGLSLMQDLSSPASVAMKTFADSGTPERGLTMGMLGGGVALGANPHMLAAAASIPAIYNPAMQWLLRGAAAGAPQTRTAISQAIQADAHRLTPGLLSSLIGGQ